jgi:hypothetical protein
MLLDPDRVKSVTAAADKLNAGLVVPPGSDDSCCIVFSASSQSYYLLHRGPLRKEDAMAKLHRAEAQRLNKHQQRPQQHTTGGSSNGRAQCSANSGVQRHCQPRVSSGMTAAARTTTTGKGGSRFEVEEFETNGASFDPTQGRVKAELTARLCGSSGVQAQDVTIERPPSLFGGGQNHGLWNLRSPGSVGSTRSSVSSSKEAGARGAQLNFVLKLVKSKRKGSSILTEAEGFISLFEKHPAIVDDPHLAFPLKILKFTEPGGMRGEQDLIVMREVPGQRLSDLIAHKHNANQTAQIMQILEEIGSLLREFHARYGNKQHGDFQPSNIMYDETTRRGVFIDISGMAQETSKETDMERFCGSLSLLSGFYGPQFFINGKRHIEKGYARRRHTTHGGATHAGASVVRSLRR